MCFCDKDLSSVKMMNLFSKTHDFIKYDKFAQENLLFA